MINLDKKLKSYSLLATGVLAFGGVQAQIQYTDIEPDSVINRNETMLINMNNGGKAEFKIQNTFSSSVSSGSSSIYNLLTLTPVDSNEFLGIQSNIVTSSSSSTYLFVPSVLGANDNIGPSESYWTDNSYGILYANVKYAYGSYSFNVKAGKWLNEEDAYAGVRFLFQGDSIWHYGWIRLSVPNDSTIIVKDFAYESHAGKAIKAGQTYSAVEEKGKDFKLFTASKNLIIANNEENAMVLIYNTSGQLMVNRELNQGKNQIDLNHFVSGYYIVKIQYKDGVFTEKVLVK
ncbi:MAG: T9SS type A sorting domain-containing protein [Bacteroidetes bacterium]|nr:T9SS type A sorting domain-containing protein [Bacteroidota bacterium]MBT5530465.1 T9SS type A sorting domain-containing protein [Cytophagia bacterium]MBT3423124.1 T9SS type A sorting domain-containing protein [Bacteroidota bacterium]MBT3935818.1 T9SS type A sorting domain-containing protein [Bacteroidota bacterium]MBT4968884.1 T9SS type A sorting domain-containing protein [Bacteroidota bacterium]